jgi:hypothetical protein
VKRGIAANLPITARAARTSDTIKTAVDGGVSLNSRPLSVDERTVIVFSKNARVTLSAQREFGWKAAVSAAGEEAKRCVQ